jgi:hypothetical protein
MENVMDRETGYVSDDEPEDFNPGPRECAGCAKLIEGEIPTDLSGETYHRECAERYGDGMGFTINDCLTCGTIFPVEQLDENSLCATCGPVAPEPEDEYDTYGERMNEAMAAHRDRGL